MAEDMECRNCKWFEPWKNNRIGYPRGNCNLHVARRIPDGFIAHLSISGKDKWVCDSFAKRITEYCPTCGQLIEFKNANYHKAGAPEDLQGLRLDGDM